VYDVVVVGAGCIGGAIARELSRYDLRVLLLESADDVSQGATKGNSGIVHAGYDDAPGSMHARYCWPGNQMFPQLDRELRFGYQLNGSLVVATNEGERKVLDELMERGRKNGVERLRIVGREELFEMEPALNPKG
jgi:glycerol-3-phosphate dehydrogenase